MDAFSAKPFVEASRRAFPFGIAALANAAASELSPFIDDTYRRPSEPICIKGKIIAVPQRLHFVGLSADSDRLNSLNPASHCLITRATDGRLRQQALRFVVDHQSSWVAPFVLVLLGEYVIEIVEDVRDALPVLDRSVYANLVRENRPSVQRLRAKATSYWNAYYRHRYPQKRDYPGLQAIDEIERWAV
jgi:hypothetical protein